MRRTILIVAAVLLALAGARTNLHAQDAKAIAGNYCLVGVMEVGSCISLSPVGRFEYFLAYGAYDEASEGTWRMDGGQVVLDSPAYDKRPTFTLKRMQRSAGDQFDIIVENKAGRAIQGIDVTATCGGRKIRVGTTGTGGFNIACSNPPTHIQLGLAMYGLTPQSIDVTGRASAGKTYVFAFDPGDLGRKRFAAQRLTPEGSSALVMTYAGSPIPELLGKRFRYVRQ